MASTEQTTCGNKPEAGPTPASAEVTLVGVPPHSTSLQDQSKPQEEPTPAGDEVTLVGVPPHSASLQDERKPLEEPNLAADEVTLDGVPPHSASLQDERKPLEEPNLAADEVTLDGVPPHSASLQDDNKPQEEPDNAANEVTMDGVPPHSASLQNDDYVSLTADMSDVEEYHDALNEPETSELVSPMETQPSLPESVFRPLYSTRLILPLPGTSPTPHQKTLQAIQHSSGIVVMQKGKEIALHDVIQLGQGLSFKPLPGSGMECDDHPVTVNGLQGYWLRRPERSSPEWERMRRRAHEQEKIIDYGLRTSGSGRNPLAQTYDKTNVHPHGCYTVPAWNQYLQFQLPPEEWKYTERPLAPFEWPILTAFFGTAQDYYPIPLKDHVLPNPVTDIVRLFGEESCRENLDVQCPVPTCHWISSPANFDMHWNTAHTRYATAFLCPAAVAGCKFVSFRCFKVDEHLLKQGTRFYNLQREALHGNLEAQAQLRHFKENSPDEFQQTEVHANYCGKIKDIRNHGSKHTSVSILRGRYLRVRIENTNVVMPPGRPPILDWHPIDSCQRGSNLPELQHYVNLNGVFATPFEPTTAWKPANTLCAEGQFQEGIQALLIQHQSDIVHCRRGERVAPHEEKQPKIADPYAQFTKEDMAKALDKTLADSARSQSELGHAKHRIEELSARVMQLDREKTALQQEKDTLSGCLMEFITGQAMAAAILGNSLEQHGCMEAFREAQKQLPNMTFGSRLPKSVINCLLKPTEPEETETDPTGAGKIETDGKSQRIIQAIKDAQAHTTPRPPGAYQPRRK
jgi:hypothetical protein